MVIAILQVRMSSSRLPGKALLSLSGKPMLVHQVERVMWCNQVDHIVIATSSDGSDDAIALLYQNYFSGIPEVSLFRGHLADVVDRFYHAARHFPGAQIVRLTGDCPLSDPDIIDAVVEHHQLSCADYTSNCHPPTFPDGFDVEIFSMETLEKIWLLARDAVEREHVTAYLVNHQDEFSLAVYRHTTDLSAVRLTVDYPEDFVLIERIFNELYPISPVFGMNDVMNLLQQHTDWQNVNSHYQRNGGVQASCEKNRNQSFGAPDAA